MRFHLPHLRVEIPHPDFPVLRFLNLPELSEIEVTSGDITVYIPQDADLTAQIETSSGDLYSDIEFTKNEDSYTCGNGKNRMKIDTSSGDVSLKTLPE